MTEAGPAELDVLNRNAGIGIARYDESLEKFGYAPQVFWALHMEMTVGKLKKFLAERGLFPQTQNRK